MNAKSSRPVRLLLVEDNPADVRLTEEVLRDARITNEMLVVSDGVEAMQFLHRQGEYANAPMPDLILLDLNLPRKDGREVLHEIKTDDRLKQIPVIVLTTSQAQEDIRSSYDLHANCYIAKPVDLDEFIHAIQLFHEFWFTIVKLPGDWR